MKIDKETIRKAEQELIAYGIAKGEAPSVLQSLGYMLMGKDIYLSDKCNAVIDNNAVSAEEVYNAIHALTPAETRRIRAYAAEIRWGFSKKSIKSQILRFRRGGVKLKARVCSLLTECKYHTLTDLLLQNKIDEAYKWVESEM